MECVIPRGSRGWLPCRIDLKSAVPRSGHRTRVNLTLVCTQHCQQLMGAAKNILYSTSTCVPAFLVSEEGVANVLDGGANPESGQEKINKNKESSDEPQDTGIYCTQLHRAAMIKDNI